MATASFRSGSTLQRSLPTSRRQPLLGLGASAWVRTVVGVRRLLGEFIRTVHPDLTPTFPDEAKRVNQVSLAELNAFVDKLEAEATPSLADGPEVGRELPFFRQRKTMSGKVLEGRVAPLHLALPTLPPCPSENEREYAAARLIRDSQLTLEASDSGVSSRPEVPSIFTEKGAGRAAFDKVWWGQTREQMLYQALNGQDDKEVKRREAMDVFAQKYEYQLVRKYSRIKNKRRRRAKMEALNEKVTEKVNAHFGPAPPLAEEVFFRDDHEEDEDSADGTLNSRAGRQIATRILRSGYNPNLVFVTRDVTADQKREAIRRVCGMNLASDADFWLLENLWKAMRSAPPAVPLVIAAEEYKAHTEVGFIQVPWNFEVMELCDLLEEHLDEVRQGLAQRRQRYLDGSESRDLWAEAIVPEPRLVTPGTDENEPVDEYTDSDSDEEPPTPTQQRSSSNSRAQAPL